jgi:SAM-dependent methyltransferase
VRRDHYERCLERALEGCDSVLDVGCGTDSPIGRLQRKPARAVGVDGHAPAIEASRRAGIHAEYHCMPVLDVGTRFAPHSFDAVLASDLIEHLEKPDGERLLDLMESLARRRVIVFTPNGFLPQGEVDGNPYQVHRSGWTVGEMRARGYRVFGINGWRPLRGELAAIRWKPRWFWERLSLLSQDWTTEDPTHAFQILCIKEVDAAVTPSGTASSPG